MLFQIESSSECIPQKVLKEFPCLSGYNFTLGGEPRPGYCRDAYIEINTLEELLKLAEETGEPIIVTVDPRSSYYKYNLEIYDCLRE